MDTGEKDQTGDSLTAGRKCRSTKSIMEHEHLLTGVRSWVMILQVLIKSRSAE